MEIKKVKSTLPKILRLVSEQLLNNKLKSFQIKENNPENQQAQFSKQESINQYLKNKKVPSIII